MNQFVLDASMTVPWFFHDETTRLTQHLLDRAVVGEAVTPCLWPIEVLNVLIMGVRRKRMLQADFVASLEALQVLPIEVEQADKRLVLSRVTALAQEHGLSAYDASYLELALRRGIPLATQDKALRHAADAVGVPPVHPSAN